MKNELHTFHIPVMGTGHSVDSPIRVAHLGITSVISIVDDFLVEKIREYYSRAYDFPYEPVARGDEDSRARRITAYLEVVRRIVDMKMDRVRSLPFFEDNDKKKYFDLLPDESALKQDYEKMIRMPPGPGRDAMAQNLTLRMKPGSIDVNIMVKLDKVNYGPDGNPLDDEFTDARASLRGYANTSLESGIVFSAGINKGLFSYMTRFRDFYRDETGRIKKKIIIKVSDFRSAQIQGRFLAKKGLEVYEYRIESGLNCGGHTFATNGILLPVAVQEFKDKRDQLTTEFQETVEKYYADQGWPYPALASGHRPLVTVQGGIGVWGEAQRFIKDFGMDMTGWASPFLLVPEATCVDATTRKLLEQAGEADLYLSDVSPFGVPFNNVRNNGSEQWTSQKAAEGNPGSPCPKRVLVSNTEFTEKPICLSSRQYQDMKLKQIREMDISDAEKDKRCREVTVKACLCGHLASGAMITLGIVEEKDAPQLICPGPNIRWFTREYTLKEMVDHIYGRGPSLVPAERPHVFAGEIKMYVDYLQKQVEVCTGNPKEIKMINEFRDNLKTGMDFCLEIAGKTPYPGENLASIYTCVEAEEKRLNAMMADLNSRFSIEDKKAAAPRKIKAARTYAGDSAGERHPEMAIAAMER
jgi:hypothetical protein